MNKSSVGRAISPVNDFLRRPGAAGCTKKLCRRVSAGLAAERFVGIR